MRIIVAKDKKFERHNLIEKIIRIFTVPLFNSIPDSVIKKLVSGTNRDGKIVIENNQKDGKYRKQ